MPIRKVKVLIVDDSLLFRSVLEQRLSQDNYIEIVGTAENAAQALEKVETLHPDVLTLDVEMPHTNGIDFLKTLMPVHPLPVVVVSSLPLTTLNALDAGAVDFVKKPAAQQAQELDAFIRELLLKIKIASTARVGQKAAPLVPTCLPATLKSCPDTILAIGASTGGTEAILEVLRSLPAHSPGVVVVQHMPPVFTGMYAQRLDKLCQLKVREAQNGDRVVPGTALIAPGDFQMRLARDSRGYFVKVEQAERVNGHCPSVDVLFHSVAQAAAKNSVGIILTGMGGDGAKGLLAMRKAGAYTLGQDPASCVVYGMPMVAFNIGAITKQMPLQEMSREIIRHLNTLHP